MIRHVSKTCLYICFNGTTDRIFCISIQYILYNCIEYNGHFSLIYCKFYNLIDYSQTDQTHYSRRRMFLVLYKKLTFTRIKKRTIKVYRNFYFFFFFEQNFKIQSQWWELLLL